MQYSTGFFFVKLLKFNKMKLLFSVK